MKDVFIRVPVTGEGNRHIQASGVFSVRQASATTVTVTYAGGLILTLTHATAGAGNETPRDEIYAAIKSALKQHWQQVDNPLVAPSFAISAIAVSHIAVPEV